MFASNYITVNKRYSQILKLHKKILKYFPFLPPFPEKTWFRRFKASVIENRRKSFIVYSNYILEFVFQNNLTDKDFTQDIL